jgi:hypothetical protein
MSDAAALIDPLVASRLSRRTIQVPRAGDNSLAAIGQRHAAVCGTGKIPTDESGNRDDLHCSPRTNGLQ